MSWDGALFGPFYPLFFSFCVHFQAFPFGSEAVKLYSGSLASSSSSEGKVCFQWCFVNEFLITSFCSQTGVSAVEVMAFCVLGVLVLTCIVTNKSS